MNKNFAGQDMNIWKLGFEVDLYDNLIARPEMGVDEFQSFDGRSKKNQWTSKVLTRMEPEKNLLLSNVPGFFPHIPVFDKKAVDILNKYLKHTAEILPVYSKDGEFYIINIINVLDCIDYKKSKYRMFPNSDRIMIFQSYAFIEERLRGTDIFKIKDEPRKSAFVTDNFKNCVLENELSGFKFQLVWSGD